VEKVGQVVNWVGLPIGLVNLILVSLLMFPWWSLMCMLLRLVV